MERFVVEFAFRAALIAGAAALVLRVLRLHAAAAQHAVWTGVLVAMLALPIWISWGPKATLPVLPARGAPVVLGTATPWNLPVPTDSNPAFAITERSSPVSSWSVILIGAYLLGACTLLLRLTIGTVRANRLTSDSCAVPVTVGLIRPRVILPKSSKQWPQAQLDAVSTHEGEHARRRDPLVQWLALLNRALFWFHPLAWWLERKLTALAEEACDAAVLQHGHDPLTYSEYLLDLARTVQRAGMRVNVTGMAMPGSYLPQRIKKIMAGAIVSRASPVRMACALVACAICSAMFAAGRLAPKPAWALLAQGAQSSSSPLVRVDYFPLTETAVLTNITVQIENKDLHFQAQDAVEKATVNIHGRITSASNQVVNVFEDPVLIEAPASMLGEIVKRTSVYQKSHPLAPGLYHLSLQVRYGVDGGMHNYELALNVPDHDPDKLSVSSLILADMIQTNPANRGGMFLVGGAKVRPRVSNIFHRTEKLGIYLQAYNFTPDPNTQKPDGTVVFEIVKNDTGAVFAFSEPVNPIEGVGTAQVTIAKLLPLGSLEPGQYTLRLKLTDKIRNQTITTSAGFAIE